MLEPALIEWRDGEPFASRFGDIYHSPDGIREVQQVFLEPAGTTARLERRPRRLLVGELGFGTGLNFAVLAGRCLEAGVPLHFVSVDCAPLALGDFERLAQARSAELPIYRELASCYPPLLPGWHQRTLANGHLKLSLFLGDVGEALSQLGAEQQAPFDLWLLDGFAPDRNPDMWSQRVFDAVAAVSTRDTSVSTFTAAGRVRRGLEQAGFRMRRVDQQPFKRESLAGSLEAGGLAPWTSPERVQIVGAGLAGASLARHLADVGIASQVLEQATPASGASAIEATVLHGRLLADDSPASLLRAHGYLYASSFLRRFGSTVSGALQVPSGNYPPARLEAVAARFAGTGRWLELLSAEASAERAGLPLTVPTLHFPEAQVLRTPAVTATLLDDPAIEVLPGSRLTAWPEGPAVLACAAACRAFEGAGYLEVTEIGGQVDRYARSAPEAPGPALVGNGYLAPLGATAVVGATYEHAPWAPEEATRANGEHLARLTGAAAESYRWLGRARGVRCVSSDRTAIVGALTDRDGAELTGRYVSTGHGSMGTVSGPYAAALLTARLQGDFAPATPSLTALLAPQRFRARQARRGYRFGARG